jgi:hypothetical protein
VVVHGDTADEQRQAAGDKGLKHRWVLLLILGYVAFYHGGGSFNKEEMG